MVDNSMQVVENVFNDYCFYSEVYEIDRVVKKEELNKVSSSIYKELKTKMTDEDIYMFFDYFIKSLLVDQISGKKIDEEYLAGRASSIDEEIEKAAEDRKCTNDVEVVRAKIKALGLGYNNK